MVEKMSLHYQKKINFLNQVHFKYSIMVGYTTAGGSVGLHLFQLENPAFKWSVRFITSPSAFLRFMVTTDWPSQHQLGKA